MSKFKFIDCPQCGQSNHTTDFYRRVHYTPIKIKKWDCNHMQGYEKQDICVECRHEKVDILTAELYYKHLKSQVFMNEYVNHLNKIFRQLLAQMKMRDRAILIMKFGLFGCKEYSHQRIGDLLGVSKQGISCIVNLNLRKLKRQLKFK